MLKRKYIYEAIFVLIGIIIATAIYRSVFSPSLTIKADEQSVIQELRQLNRLDTVQFTIEKIIDAGTDGGAFKQFLFGDRILLIASGFAVAGFDLSNLPNGTVKISGDAITVHLPKPAISLATLDNEKTRVFDRKLGLLTKGDETLESKARAQAEQIIRKAACEGGILTTASYNARNQLTHLFKGLGFASVVIEIPETVCE